MDFLLPMISSIETIHIVPVDKKKSILIGQIDGRG